MIFRHIPVPIYSICIGEAPQKIEKFLLHMYKTGCIIIQYFRKNMHNFFLHGQENRSMMNTDHCRERTVGSR